MCVLYVACILYLTFFSLWQITNVKMFLSLSLPQGLTLNLSGIHLAKCDRIKFRKSRYCCNQKQNRGNKKTQTHA